MPDESEGAERHTEADIDDREAHRDRIAHAVVDRPAVAEAAVLGGDRERERPQDRDEGDSVPVASEEVALADHHERF
jgi:hypothetical protein